MQNAEIFNYYVFNLNGKETYVPFFKQDPELALKQYIDNLYDFFSDDEDMPDYEDQ